MAIVYHLLILLLPFSGPRAQGPMAYLPVVSMAWEQIEKGGPQSVTFATPDGKLPASWRAAMTGEMPPDMRAALEGVKAVNDVDARDYRLVVVVGENTAPLKKGPVADFLKKAAKQGAPVTYMCFLARDGKFACPK